ncbi:MAG TPA: hypothetical protein PKD61_25355, partial [Polyangiaceae bacterium]|nr:hypothetical protein [Polyangiaceae bacterium]
MTQGIRRNAAALLALSPGLLMLGCAVSSKDADPVAETTARLGSGGFASGGTGTGGTGTVGGTGASGGAGGS